MSDVTVGPGGGSSDTGHRQILALHGGGYRGLYTARVLEKLEQSLPNDTRITDIFDMVTGTSIGGIIALALASGHKAATIREAIESHGPKLFPHHGPLRKGWQTLRRVLGAPHDQQLLKELISEILGKSTASALNELPLGVVVPALDATGNTSGPRPVIFSNHSDSPTARVPLIDIALATSAAPTYLPSYTPPTSRDQLVDGGIIANSPSWIALTTAIADYGWHIDKLRMLVIGTTTSAYGRIPKPSNPISGTAALKYPLRWLKERHSEGIAYWLTKGRLFDLLMEGQQRLADTMCSQALTNSRCFVINSIRSTAQDRVAKSLNQASNATTDTLLKLADDATEDALSSEDVRRLMNRRAWRVRAGMLDMDS